MNFLLEVIKEAWSFAIIWKVMATLFLQKKQEQYGRGLLGMILFFTLISPVLRYCDGQFQVKIEDVFTNCEKEFENTEKLFTFGEEIKTRINDEKPINVESSETLENSGVTKKEEEKEMKKINIKLLEKREISTIGVEKFQSIQKK